MLLCVALFCKLHWRYVSCNVIFAAASWYRPWSCFVPYCLISRFWYGDCEVYYILKTEPFTVPYFLYNFAKTGHSAEYCKTAVVWIKGIGQSCGFVQIFRRKPVSSALRCLCTQAPFCRMCVCVCARMRQDVPQSPNHLLTARCMYLNSLVWIFADLKT